MEIREGRKQHGLAIGIASDENTGHGLNYEKRSRLINAGADIIISNYSEPDILLNLILG